MTDTFGSTLNLMFQNYFHALLAFLPGFLIAVAVILVGWVLARFLGLIGRWILKLSRFDLFCGHAGISHILSRADIEGTPSWLAGRLVFWVIFLLFVMGGLNALGLEIFKGLMSAFLLFLPNVFTAAAILLGGTMAGAFLARAALLAAVNAGLPSPRSVSLLLKYTIFTISFAMALEQLHIAGNIVLAAFIISFGAVMLGLAIAFGLGGKDLARRLLEERLNRRKPDQPDEISHL